MDERSYVHVIDLSGPFPHSAPCRPIKALVPFSAADVTAAMQRLMETPPAKCCACFPIFLSRHFYTFVNPATEQKLFNHTVATINHLH